MLIAIELVAGVSVALGSEIGPAVPAGERLIAVALVVVLLAATATHVLRERQRLSAAWFVGRAAAESAKTASWRYMMRAQPYVDDGYADAQLQGALEEIRRTVSTSLPAAARQDSCEPTATMRRLRAAHWRERQFSYVQYRLDNQTAWYGARRRYNQRRSRLFSIAVIAGQGLTILVAVAHALETSLSFVGTFTTMTASLIAWAQTRRFDELAESYALAERELEEIRERAVTATEEGPFSELVADAEGAISREHTMWLTRRLPRSRAAHRD